MPPVVVKFILLVLCCQMCPLRVASKKGTAIQVTLPSFSWDPRNKCFNSSKNTNGKRYAHMMVDQGSSIYFICPSIAITYDVQSYYTPKRHMYENMYMCTQEEFNNCQLGGEYTEKTRLVMKCDNPLDTQKLKYKHFTFDRLRSGPERYAFEAGLTYFFIATSNGTEESLGNREGGRCNTNNMRLAITICEIGKKCHLNNSRCNDEETLKGIESKEHLPLLSDTSTEPPAQTNSIKKTQQIIPQNIDASVRVSDSVLQALRSAKQDGSSLAKEHILYITLAAIGGLFVGILLTAGVWGIKRASHDGSFLSAYCCYKRSKLPNEKVNQPLC